MFCRRTPSISGALGLGCQRQSARLCVASVGAAPLAVSVAPVDHPVAWLSSSQVC